MEMGLYSIKWVGKTVLFSPTNVFSGLQDFSTGEVEMKDS